MYVMMILALNVKMPFLLSRIYTASIGIFNTLSVLVLVFISKTSPKILYELRVIIYKPEIRSCHFPA